MLIHHREFLQNYFTILWCVNMSLARCMYAYANTLMIRFSRGSKWYRSRYKKIFAVFSVTMYSFLYSTVVATSCSLMFSLLYVSAWYQRIQLGWDLFSKHLPRSLCMGGHFQRVTFMCDGALSLPLATEFLKNKHNMGHSWHWEQNSVLVASVEAVII